MHGVGERQTFDAAERELIRKKLIRYMEENGIGVPRLAKRIKASFPREIETPLSTLQRFLRRQGQNVSCVAQCHRFVEKQHISDFVAALGERLSAFYGAGNGRVYAGTYLSANMYFARVLSRSEIDIAADDGFWRLTEKVTYPGHQAIYDGALVCSGDAAVVVLKDRLAGLARNYILWPENEGLRARGTAVRYSVGDTNRILRQDKSPRLESIKALLIKTA
jgi:hypothetical protein